MLRSMARPSAPEQTDAALDDTSVGTGAWGEMPSDHDDGRPETNSLTLLSEIIDTEIAAIERTLAIGGLFMAIIGFTVAVYTAIVADARLGVPLAIVALLALGYFMSVRRLLDERPDFTFLRTFSPIVEQIFPFVVTVVIIATQGAAYALGSWVPPILYTGILLQNLFRLRPGLSLAMGALSSGGFAIITFIMVPLLDERPLPDTELYSVRMQLARCLTLFLVGAVIGAATLILRRAMSQGASRLRAVDLFGKYRLGREIAVGGMGSVIRATYCPEGGFERPVAIKRIHPHLGRDPRFVDGFRHEAQLCARLLHPNIVQVLDFGRAMGTYFFAMEYVDGANLSQIIARSRQGHVPFPPRLVAQIGVELGEALHFAHVIARGPSGERLRIIHRDVNPRNVLISRVGEVKLADFGIARMLGERVHHETRHLMGSLAYLAPEQAKAEAIDERADLFSLGLVLHEMLTGRPLFQRPTEVGTLRAVVEAPLPDYAAALPDLDPSFAALLTRALQRDPDDRFPSAAAMVEALKAQLEREGQPGPDELAHLVRDLLALPTAHDRDASHDEDAPTRDILPPHAATLVGDEDVDIHMMPTQTEHPGLDGALNANENEDVDEDEDEDDTHLDLQHR
jgi:serine/threonine protein kinase